MPLWSIEPIARADDPRWLDHGRWRQVIVRAPSAATARLLAGQLEETGAEPPAGNESLSFRNTLADEKLYWVRPLTEHAEWPQEGRDGVLHAEPEAPTGPTAPT